MEASSAPDVSDVSSRVSEMVSTAMCKGMKGTLSSMRVMVSLQGGLDHEEVAPGVAFGRPVPQEVGRMQRGERGDVAPGASIFQPPAPEPHDALADAEQGFGR